jgi:hypothetical protein
VIGKCGHIQPPRTCGCAGAGLAWQPGTIDGLALASCLRPHHDARAGPGAARRPTFVTRWVRRDSRPWGTWEVLATGDRAHLRAALEQYRPSGLMQVLAAGPLAGRPAGPDRRCRPGASTAWLAAGAFRFGDADRRRLEMDGSRRDRQKLPDPRLLAWQPVSLITRKKCLFRKPKFPVLDDRIPCY